MIHYRPGKQNPADTLLRCPDYHIPEADKSQPTMFNLKFHTTYSDNKNQILKL